MKKLNRRDMLLVGLTLFSMFFGAGNLIFPPFLGAQAGTSTWVAMVGFALSAIGLPILGVVAVAKSGGLPALAGRVGPHFAWVFTLLVYLSIGPGLAIPRTASTSFEMAVTPFLAGHARLGAAVLCSGVFYRCNADCLPAGKIDRPAGKSAGAGAAGADLYHCGGLPDPCAGRLWSAHSKYVGNVLSQGFVDGYQTMDTLRRSILALISALQY